MVWLRLGSRALGVSAGRVQKLWHSKGVVQQTKYYRLVYLEEVFWIFRIYRLLPRWNPVQLTSQLCKSTQNKAVVAVFFSQILQSSLAPLMKPFHFTIIPLISLFLSDTVCTNIRNNKRNSSIFPTTSNKPSSFLSKNPVFSFFF